MRGRHHYQSYGHDRKRLRDPAILRRQYDLFSNTKVKKFWTLRAWLSSAACHDTIAAQLRSQFLAS
jgi:hypothetical protein